jgi:hypothetical protein
MSFLKKMTPSALRVNKLSESKYLLGRDHLNGESKNIGWNKNFECKNSKFFIVAFVFFFKRKN